MIFSPASKPRPYEVTSRKVAAFERRKRREREALPLLSAHVADHQVPTEVEMARRTARWDEVAAYMRQAKAAAWRDVRARYYALPPHVRAVLRIEWERFGGPKTSVYLGSLIRRVAGELGACPEDFPELDAAARLALTASINDRARQDDPSARCTRAYSPEVGAWLCPASGSGAVGKDLGRFMSLWRAIAAFEAFGPGVDPTGERRAGVVEVDGKRFRFDILPLRPGKELVSPTPWNADLSRRVIWVTFQDELLDYFGAAEVFR